jgi:hypothetical protein
MKEHILPEKCTPKQRTDEIVQILATGFLRLQQKQQHIGLAETIPLTCAPTQAFMDK